MYISMIQNVYAEYVDGNLRYVINNDEEDVFDEYIRRTLAGNDYDQSLTLLEFLTHWFVNAAHLRVLGSGNTEQYYVDTLNEVFEKECVGYRMIDEKIVAITDPIEIKEIEDCLDIQFQGPKSHIQKALGFLADREHKDYKNSIKESISAVESICEIIVGSESATLGKALKALKDKKINIHPALEKAFSSLYGYTSDEGGIRHAEGLFESNVSFEEAKYMLVSCCAFVNYLIAEYGKTETGKETVDNE